MCREVCPSGWREHISRGHARRVRGLSCDRPGGSNPVENRSPGRLQVAGVSLWAGGTLCCVELRLESYCSCEHEERGAGRAVCVRERGVETQRAKRSQRRVDVCHLGLEGHVWQVWCRLVVQVCGSWHLMSSSDTAPSLLGLFWTGFQRRPLLQTPENCCRLSSVGRLSSELRAVLPEGEQRTHIRHIQNNSIQRERALNHFARLR